VPTKKVLTKLYFYSCNGAATALGARCSTSLPTAMRAAEEYSLDRGYPCEAFLCENCKQYHVRQSLAPREIPEEDRWTPSRHRALRARVREMEAARRAEVKRVREEKLAAERAVKEADVAARRAAKEAPPEIPFVAKVKKVRAPKSQAERVTAAVDKQSRRDERRAAGLCPHCGAAPPSPGRKMCEACRTRSRNYTRDIRQSKKNGVVRTAEEIHERRSKAGKMDWVRRKATSATLLSSPASVVVMERAAA
jgi:hypothetical protein